MSNTLHTDNHDHNDHTTQIDTFGFWLYLMTDCILFGCLFATFIVLSSGVAPFAFDLNLVLTETLILLTSSFTFGLTMIQAHRKNLKATLLYLGITFILGLSFLYLEISEFKHLINSGHDWTKSGYWSAFFTLVGTHGLHIVFGLLWIASITIQLLKHGLNAITIRKLTLLSLFWHFLDIVWIFVFSIVYLIGGLA
jgi:cytochrome o ubiquinol oxidase subunit 3